jgi:hypothetical protein
VFFLFHFFHVENLVKFNLAKKKTKINRISLEEKSSKIFPITLLKNSKISPEKEKH